MFCTEPQAKALHWRDLSSTYMQREDVRKSVMDQNKKWLAHCTQGIIILTGENTLSPLHNIVYELAWKSGIIEQAADLSKKIIHSFFSVHLVTFCPQPMSFFNLDEMEADDEDLRKGQVPLRNRVVMCTIEPGLREIISGIERSGKERILRKAKVVLEPL